MQIEGGEDDIPERENPLDEEDSHHSTHSTSSGQSHGDDSVHETPPGGRETGYDWGFPGRGGWIYQCGRYQGLARLCILSQTT